MITLISFMVVNNWTIIVQVYIDITGSQMPIVYFMLFWIMVDLIILNLVIAVILEIYASVEEDITARFKKFENTNKLMKKYENRSLQDLKHHCLNVNMKIVADHKLMEGGDASSFGADTSMLSEEDMSGSGSGSGKSMDKLDQNKTIQ